MEGDSPWNQGKKSAIERVHALKFCRFLRYPPHTHTGILCEWNIYKRPLSNLSHIISRCYCYVHRHCFHIRVICHVFPACPLAKKLTLCLSEIYRWQSKLLAHIFCRAGNKRRSQLEITDRLQKSCSG